MRPDIQYRPVKPTMRIKKVKYSFINRFGSKLAERDGGFYCHYCGIPVVRAKNKPRIKALLRTQGLGIASVDHKMPLSKGGSNKLENMVLSCHDCNQRKGDSDYKPFIRMLEFEHVLKSCNQQNQPQAQRR